MAKRAGQRSTKDLVYTPYYDGGYGSYAPTPKAPSRMTVTGQGKRIKPGIGSTAYKRTFEEGRAGSRSGSALKSFPSGAGAGEPDYLTAPWGEDGY